jgi:hypothetical protein
MLNLCPAYVQLMSEIGHNFSISIISAFNEKAENSNGYLNDGIQLVYISI